MGTHPNRPGTFTSPANGVGPSALPVISRSRPGIPASTAEDAPPRGRPLARQARANPPLAPLPTGWHSACNSPASQPQHPPQDHPAVRRRGRRPRYLRSSSRSLLTSYVAKPAQDSPGFASGHPALGFLASPRHSRPGSRSGHAIGSPTVPDRGSLIPLRGRRSPPSLGELGR